MSINTKKSMVSERENDNHLSDAYFCKHIANINESDFWSSWNIREPQLREACRLGKLLKRKEAYQLLADYHLINTRNEFEQSVLKAHSYASTPQKKQALFTEADNIFNGNIKIGNQIEKVGKRIDFRKPIGRNGVYALNNLSWLDPLINRFLISRNEKDLNRILDILKQFYDCRNSLSRPISRLHPIYYELGSWQKTLRLLPAYFALINADKVRPDAVEVFMKLFLGFGRSLYRLQSTGYRHANWQVVGSVALFRLSIVFPQWKESTKWKKLGLKMVLEHIRHDFYQDGGPKERCWAYGWMVVRGILDCYDLGKKTGDLKGSVAAEWLQGIRRTLRWYYKTMTPNGFCPAYGDGDLMKSDEIFAAFKKYLPASETNKPYEFSALLKPSGFAVMRDNETVGSRYLNLNFGESGGGHTHGDLLDFNIWAFGEPMIEEVGRFDTYDHPLNPFFKSPEAHNQIVLDSLSMDRHSSEGQDIRWHSLPELDYFSGWHDAFRAPGVLWPLHMEKIARIHRHVLFVRNAYWLFYDIVEPIDGSADSASTIFSISSYLHSPWPFQMMGPRKAKISGNSAGSVIAFAPNEFLRRLESGVDIAKEDVTAPRLYDERHFLRARAWGATGYQGNISMAMVIYPHQGRVPLVQIQQLKMVGSIPGKAEAFEIRTPAGLDRVVFNPSRLKGLSIGGKKLHGTLNYWHVRKLVTLP